MASDLTVLIPTRVFNTSKGAIKLSPFWFKDFHNAITLVERYVQVFMVANTAAEIAERLFAKTQEDYKVIGDIKSLLGLVIESDTPINIDELRFDEVLNLVVEVIDMNLDFFKRIGERLNNAQSAEPPAA